MFGLQTINDEMNKFPLNLITFGTCWPQELPANHMQSFKSNAEILKL